ncbi:MAG TPA: peptidoglycan-associated lipoprotein Pal [Gammaproteobacteria bacterium]
MRILPKLSVALVFAVLLLNGCGTTGEAEQEQGAVAGGGAAAGSAEDAAAAAAAAKAAEEAKARELAKEQEKQALETGLLAQRVVYFDFDSSVVHDESMPMLKAHSEYLASNGNKITVEGHCDERGTREYNIALGERRADAVRRILLANGVSASQIKVVSYGEERPAALGHDEKAWALNRRGELMY